MPYKNERNTTPFKDLQLTLDRTHKRSSSANETNRNANEKQQGIQLLEHSRQELLHALHSVIDEKDLFENGLKHPVLMI